MTELLWAGVAGVFALLFVSTYLIRLSVDPPPPAIEQTCRHDSLKFDSMAKVNNPTVGLCWAINTYCTLCGEVQQIVTGCSVVEKQSNETVHKRIAAWMGAAGWLYDEEEMRFIKG